MINSFSLNSSKYSSGVCVAFDFIIVANQDIFSQTDCTDHRVCVLYYTSSLHSIICTNVKGIKAFPHRLCVQIVYLCSK